MLSVLSIREVLARMTRTEVIHAVADVEVLCGGNMDAVVY